MSIPTVLAQGPARSAASRGDGRATAFGTGAAFGMALAAASEMADARTSPVTGSVGAPAPVPGQPPAADGAHRVPPDGQADSVPDTGDASTTTAAEPVAPMAAPTPGQDQEHGSSATPPGAGEAHRQESSTTAPAPGGADNAAVHHPVAQLAQQVAPHRAPYPGHAEELVGASGRRTELAQAPTTPSADLSAERVAQHVLGGSSEVGQHPTEQGATGRPGGLPPAVAHAAQQPAPGTPTNPRLPAQHDAPASAQPPAAEAVGIPGEALPAVNAATSAPPSPGSATVPAPASPAPAVPPTSAAPPAPASPAPPAPPAPLHSQLTGPAVSLAAAGDGEHTMTVSVAPENLGPVTVRAHISGGEVRIELFAPNDAGRDALRALVTDLRRDLAGLITNAALSLAASDSPPTSQPSQHGPTSSQGSGQHHGGAGGRGDAGADGRHGEDPVASYLYTEPGSEPTVGAEAPAGDSHLDVLV